MAASSTCDRGRALTVPQHWTTALSLILVTALGPQAFAAPMAVDADPQLEAVYEAHIYRLGSRVAISAEAAASVSLAGADVRLAGTVAGNGWLAGADVSIEGTLGGDLWAVGGRVQVSGPIGGAANISGATVDIDGGVGARQGLSAFGALVAIGPEARLTGDVTIAAARVSVSGDVRGALRVTADDVTVNAIVAGPVRVTAQRLVIGPDARLEQGAIVDVREPVAQSPSAQVYHGIRTRADAAGEWEIPTINRPITLAPLPWWTIAAIGASTWVAAMVLAWLAPGIMGRAAVIGRIAPLRVIVSGGVVLAAWCGVAVVLVASLAGGLFGVAALAAAPLVVLAGLGGGAYSLGSAVSDRVPRLRHRPTWGAVSSIGVIALASGIGTIALALALVVPVAGVVGAGLLALWGLGALWRARGK